MMQEGQSQEEQQRYFIVIFGPPASGKTTLAHQLLSSLNEQVQSRKLKLNSALISADCCEEYLRNHSENELEDLLSKQKGWEDLNKRRLKRSLFSEELWKNSRNYIKRALPRWLTTWNVVVLQDDLLLKSQRKQMRQLVEHMNIRYIELYRPLALEECLTNIKQRQADLNQDEHLSILKVKECYQKFESEKSPYTFQVEQGHYFSWKVVQKQAKKVIIEHPELEQKLPVCEQDAAKNDVQVQIRNFVTDLMTNKQLRKKYFGEKDLKDVASQISKLKKGYKEKSKSIEGFINYLQTATAKMI